jgi:hypothetical protein
MASDRVRELKALLDRPAEQAEFDGGPAPEDQILREEIPDSADIWEHVQFRHPPQWRLGGGPLAPGRSYLSFEGEVSWEPEHGLQLVFEDGQHVCKVSPYDGHVTVAHAYGDSSLLGVVVR